MRINHNIQALNAYRQLSQNQSVISKNLEKLSSGLRINRAADDAAGLAISEKMRSQIRGLAMAERNTMDGISLIQTAEGALGTTHAILQRMRELAVQAANGTLEDHDRQAIQDEIDQLTQEIDRIAKTTQFNAKVLLRGSAEGRPFASTNSPDIAYQANGTWQGVVTAAPTAPAQVEINFDFAFGNQADTVVDGQTFVINGKTYEIDITGGASPGLSNTSHIAVNVATWNNGGTDADAVANVNAVLAALKNAIDTNDPTFDGNSIITNAGSTGPDNSVLEPNGSLLLKTRVNMDPAQAATIALGASPTGVNYYEPGTTTPVTTVVADQDAVTATSISLSLAETPKAGDSLQIDGFTINFVTGATPTTSPTPPLTSPVNINIDNQSVYDVLSSIDQLLTSAKTNTSYVPALTSHSVVGNTLILSTTKTDDGGAFGSNNGLEVQFVDADFEANAGLDMKLDMQIGANVSEEMELTIGVMDAASLGLARQADHTTVISTPGLDAVAGIDVSSSTDAARAAITAIDEAIKKVSEERSKLGAYQNRMEYTISNLGIAQENLTAAESRIRDADMAQEMTNYTKNNIINQAATAMLAQANQLPQGILQLLK